MTTLVNPFMSHPAVGGPFLSDSFNRADGSLGNADTGQPWSTPAGTFSISSNQAASASGDGLAIVTATADGDLSIDGAVATAYVSSLVFRYSDASNFYYVYDWPGGSNISIRKVQGGSDIEYASVARTASSGLVTYRVVLNGTAIDLYRNGVLMFSTTSSFNASATGVGMRVSNGGGQANRWDNLSMEAL